MNLIEDGDGFLIRLSNHIFQEIEEQKAVSDGRLASLLLLFDKHFEKAVQIVDHRGVFAFEGEVSKRRVFQVVGHKSTDRYTVFPGHYCSCHSFFFDVVNKNESVYCKHQLAVKLSEALQHTRTTVVNDLVIAEILQS